MVIELSNTGDVPIRVDRDLVFRVAVRFFGQDDRPIQLQHIGSVPRPAQSELESRLVLLQPGGKVARSIELDKPFRVFGAARGITSGQPTRMIISGYEALCRVPENDSVKRIEIEYSKLGMIMDDGLTRYLGSREKADQLFEGPLNASLSR